MIPIRDTIPSRTTPVVTWLLVAINVAIFLYEVSLGPEVEGLVQLYGLIPARLVGAIVIDGAPSPLVTLLSSLFVHGGWMHVGGNMLYLWIFGDNVEDRLGHGRYLVFYLLCGAISGLTHAAFFPESRIPTVGASGAIAGVLGAYFILYPRARVVALVPIIIIPWFVRIPAVIYIGLWFVMQLLSSGVIAGGTAAEGSGVAFMAHVGGFVAGIVLCLLLKPPLHEEPPGETTYSRWRST